MPTNSEPNARVVLLGLPADIAESVGQIVSDEAAVLYIPPLFPVPQSLVLIRKAAPDLIFVWTGDNSDAFLLEAVQKAEPHVTAVAVNSHVRNQAPEFGPVDYCNPPFGLTRIQEVLRAATMNACC